MAEAKRAIANTTAKPGNVGQPWRRTRKRTFPEVALHQVIRRKEVHDPARVLLVQRRVVKHRRRNNEDGTVDEESESQQRARNVKGGVADVRLDASERGSARGEEGFLRAARGGRALLDILVVVCASHGRELGAEVRSVQHDGRTDDSTNESALKVGKAE